MRKSIKSSGMAFRFKRFARKKFSVFNSLGKAVTIGVLSGCALASAHAASVNPKEKSELQIAPDTLQEVELDEIVVTATKADLPLNLASKQVTLITSIDIERAPVRSIQDMLTHIAGVDVQQRGPHGVQADISLRGGTFDQVAILLNGVNLSNPQTGHYSFDIPINLSDIDHIEIVQGPSSLVYGASAFAGGINIITKKDAHSNAFIEAGAGMHALAEAEARLAVKSQAWLNTISAGYQRSDGYMDNSDYKIANVLWQSQFRTNDAAIDIQAGFNDKKYGANTFYSAAYPHQFDDTKGIFFSVKGESTGKLKLMPQIYWSRHYDTFQLFRDGTPNIPASYKGHNYHRSDVFGANLNMQYASKLGITSFGAEMRNEGILSNVLGKAMSDTIDNYTLSDNRTNISFFAEHHFVFDRYTLSVGGLLNHNTALPDQFSFYPSINASFRPISELRLYASWNIATRMPTFTELYYTTPTHIGNTNLEAERSEAFEVGLHYRKNIFRTDLAAFYMRGRNLIDWVKTSPDALWESRNHTKLDKTGFEASVNLNLTEWLGSQQPLQTFSIGYMHIHQNLLKDELISNYALNYLRNKFTASLQHEIVKNLSLSWNFRWQDRVGTYVRYVDLKPAETVHFKPFSVLDAKIAYQWKKMNFFVDANNIFDKKYIDLGNIPQAGFWLSGGANIRF